MKAALCTKCSMRWALQETGIYPLCYVCFLKSKKLYRSAMKAIKDTDWWNYKTGIGKLKIGWSFANRILTALMFGALSNCGSLNKNPKCPELLHKTKLEKMRLLGVCEWQAKITSEYYNLED